jgi:hypothetical protein
MYRLYFENYTIFILLTPISKNLSNFRNLNKIYFTNHKLSEVWVHLEHLCIDGKIVLKCITVCGYKDSIHLAQESVYKGGLWWAR